MSKSEYPKGKGFGCLRGGWADVALVLFMSEAMLLNWLLYERLRIAPTLCPNARTRGTMFQGLMMTKRLSRKSIAFTIIYSAHPPQCK